jgi:hypothetical protein
MVEGSCCEPYTCFEAKCSIPRGCVGEELSCVDDYPCCEDEGLTCVDGVCAVAGTTASGETVTTVTTAGVGDPPTSSGWLGILAAGGAMAAAATVLRRNRRDPVDDHIA